MDINKIIAKLELKNMLEKFLNSVQCPHLSAELADAQNWTRKNLSSFRSCVKMLLPPCSRISFWTLRPNIYGAVAKVDFYELKDGYAEVKMLHAPDYDENEAENIRNIHEDEFFHMLRRAIIYNLFFFPPDSSATTEHCPGDYDRNHDVSFIPKSKNLEFTRLILQLLGANI